MRATAKINNTRGPTPASAAILGEKKPRIKLNNLRSHKNGVNYQQELRLRNLKATHQLLAVPNAIDLARTRRGKDSPRYALNDASYNKIAHSPSQLQSESSRSEKRHCDSPDDWAPRQIKQPDVYHGHGNKSTASSNIARSEINVERSNGGKGRPAHQSSNQGTRLVKPHSKN